MTLLDAGACQAFCAMVGEPLGPVMTEILFGGLGLALVWWRGKKAADKAHARADVAVTAVRETKEALAELRGSLRPAGFTPLPPAPVEVRMPEIPPGIMPPARPSMPDPSLLGETRLPSPPPMPFEQAPSARPPDPKGTP